MSGRLKADFQELESIRAEMKTLNIRRAKLRKKCLEIESRIQETLREKDQPGVKYNGFALIVKNKEVPSKKSQREQIEDTKKVLESYGIKDTDKALVDLAEAKKGALIPKYKVEIKKLKQNK